MATDVPDKRQGPYAFGPKSSAEAATEDAVGAVQAVGQLGGKHAERSEGNPKVAAQHSEGSSETADVPDRQAARALRLRLRFCEGSGSHRSSVGRLPKDASMRKG